MANPGTIRVKEGSSWVDILHPINSWYFSAVSTSPASLFGGTWQQITNAVLRAAVGYGYGGSDNHILTINELPAHTHRDNNHTWLAYIGNSSGSCNGGSNTGGTNLTWDASITTTSLTSISTGGGKPFQSFLVIAISTVGYEPRRGDVVCL